MSRIMESDFDCDFYMQIVSNSTKDQKKIGTFQKLWMNTYNLQFQSGTHQAL